MKSLTIAALALMASFNFSSTLYASTSAQDDVETGSPSLVKTSPAPHNSQGENLTDFYGSAIQWRKDQYTTLTTALKTLITSASDCTISVDSITRTIQHADTLLRPFNPCASNEEAKVIEESLRGESEAFRKATLPFDYLKFDLLDLKVDKDNHVSSKDVLKLLDTPKERYSLGKLYPLENTF